MANEFFVPQTFRVLNYSFLFIVLFLSCKKKCFKTIGDSIKEERSVNPFRYILLNDEINLVITQDSLNKVEVEGGKNLVPFIKTDVENNRLKISDENKCDFLRSYKSEITLYVSAMRIDSISSYGSGKIISTNTLVSDKMVIILFSGNADVNVSVEAKYSRYNIESGGGDITVSGSSQKCYFYSMGNGFIRAENYVADYANIRQLGTGDFYINAKNEMSVEIYESGSVYYKGNPVIIKQIIEGEGQLIRY